MMRHILIFILILPLTVWAGDTYYVRTGGDNTNAGTSWAAAWRTINKADSTISAGDTVRIGSGVYYDCNIQGEDPTGTERTVWACSTFTTSTPPGQGPHVHNPATIEATGKIK